MAARRIQDLLNNPFVSIKYILELDIEGCFDNMDHDYIMENVPFIPRCILKEWLNCGFIVGPSSNYNPTENEGLQPFTGIPQGSIISPTICNIILDGIDLNYRVKMKRGPKCYFIRFADDMNILIPPEFDPNKILSEIKLRLAERGLKISEAKTRILTLQSGKITKLNFCGFLNIVMVRNLLSKFNKQIQKCLLYPKTDNIAGHKDKIRSKTWNKKKNRTVGLPRLIASINPIITGFCNFYRFGNCSQQFGSLSIWLYHFMINYLHRRKKRGGLGIKLTDIFQSSRTMNSAQANQVGFGIKAHGVQEKRIFVSFS
jgi:RNA-directed DNA polymerase